jgi:3-hydroxyisobutyrate dehydrogenase-like beta-hydroxyacid dehydrogenase
LLEADHDLTVWNRTATRAEPLERAGASVAASPSAAGAGAQVAITMLTGPDALEEVLFGSEGLANALAGGSVLIEMSTVGPAAIEAIAERLPAGVELVDAPVMGSVAEATDGSLRVVVGGSDEAVEGVRPILETFGSIRHVGASGAGAAMKLVANSTLGAAIVGLGEALALADALGLERSSVLDVLEGSNLSPVVRSKRESIEADRYPPRFKLSLAAKDLALVTQAAADAGLELRGAASTRSWFEEAEVAGQGDEDYSAVVRTILGGGELALETPQA